MRRVVVDTNVLISFLTDRNAEQQAQAVELFEAAAEGEIELILHQMVISEMVYVLGNLYQVEVAEIAEMIDDLLCSPGVKPVDEVVWSRVLELWPDAFKDFADAVLAAVTLEERHDAVATFDHAFVRQLRRAGLKSWPTAEVEDAPAREADSEAPVTGGGMTLIGPPNRASTSGRVCSRIRKRSAVVASR